MAPSWRRAESLSRMTPLSPARALGSREMASAIHRQAAVGFDRGGGDYERGRPGYPADAVRALVAELGIAPGDTVVDLAAGTGKLTSSLIDTGARLVAVAGMREQLLQAVPGAEALAGTAEAILLADGAADAVVVAQAFHWFDVPRAAAEIARMQAIVHEHRGDTPQQATSSWQAECVRCSRTTRRPAAGASSRCPTRPTWRAGAGGTAGSAPDAAARAAGRSLA